MRLNKPASKSISVLWKSSKIRQQTEKHFFRKLLNFSKGQQEFMVFLPRATAISIFNPINSSNRLVRL